MNELQQVEAGVMLRRFAEGVYEQPGVEPLLLDLQDNHGCDVLLLLYACWLGQRREAASFSRWEAIVDWHWPWQAQVVTPLRTARRFLKGREDSADLYVKVKGCELEAELLQLERLASHDRGEALDIRRDDSVEEQLAACCDAQGIELSAALRGRLDRLAVLAAPL
ncbi:MULTISPECIES: TIGR02444 family protein [Pseudomonas]|uniref:TIGR02444 family protein n=1 Tax=Pseudomonas TaxID=286 RepID=UPI00123C2BF6|nr:MULTISPECIES: TIGR02444 family protein [Pseudomonas]QIB50124.1 TIGR02444 family protein [Pseudomonas sp. OIL-1]